MADDAPGWLADAPPRLRAALMRCIAGEPANIALMHLLMDCEVAGEAEAALGRAAEMSTAAGDAASAERLGAALRLLQDNPQAFVVTRAALEELNHKRAGAGGGELVAYWSAAFDRAARAHPEAGVALYSLGNPALLDAATQEIVAQLANYGVLAPHVECLDLGCGIGRLELALAPRLRRIVGIDISAGMLDRARERCDQLANVEFHLASGRDLSCFGEAGFDLVLAVDSFPYIVQSGEMPAACMLDECSRVLGPGGHLAILNYSYRGDIGRDRQDLGEFALRAGLEFLVDGSRDLRLWDGASFILRRGSHGPMGHGSM